MRGFNLACHLCILYLSLKWGSFCIEMSENCHCHHTKCDSNGSSWTHARARRCVVMHMWAPHSSFSLGPGRWLCYEAVYSSLFLSPVPSCHPADESSFSSFTPLHCVSLERVHPCIKMSTDYCCAMYLHSGDRMNAFQFISQFLHATFHIPPECKAKKCFRQNAHHRSWARQQRV